MVKFPFRGKKSMFCPIFQINWGNALILKLNFLKIEFNLKLDFWTIEL